VGTLRLALMVLSLWGRLGSPAAVLDARAFGVKADGASDDGPAIARMVEAAAKASPPVVLRFPPGREIRVETAPERYVFRLEGVSDLTLDGCGSTVLLGPQVRFLRLRRSSRVAVCNLSIDFSPLPFVDGTVSAVRPDDRCLVVRLRPGSTLPVGGPTHEDGEQAFFSMLWHQGPYGLVSRHYWTARIERGSEPRTVRVFATERFTSFGDIEPGRWHMSIPVPGIAHRYGPGACVEVHDNRDVVFEDVELWSAPWFGFRIFRNEGQVVFRRVNIRPKPGTGRLTSTWRDGFHVKGNRGRLLWEECEVSGTNDDAFNISTHASRLERVVSPTEVVVRQVFPLSPMPWREGGTLVAADLESRTLLGSARVRRVSGWTTARRLDGKPAASPVTLVLDGPIEGLRRGTMVWEREGANPHTTLRRCTIRASCRFQSPVTLEGCRVSALIWFAAMPIEGPFPSNVVVRECELRRGRGNPRLAVSFRGRAPGRTGPPAIHSVALERNRIWGDFSMVGVARARLEGNRFCERGATIRIEDCPDLVTRDNLDPLGNPWPPGEQDGGGCRGPSGEEGRRQEQDSERGRLALRDALWESLAPMVRERRFPEAVAAAREFRKASPSEFAEEVSREAIACVEAAAAFWRAAADGLRAATGKQLRLKGILWTISSFDGSQVALRSGQAQKRLSLAEFAASDLAPFVAWSGPAARWHFATACALAFEADWEGCRLEADLAPPALRAPLARMTASLRRAYAGLLAAEARAAARAAREAEASRLARILLDDYPDTPAARQNEQWARSVLAQQQEKPTKREEEDERGRWRICPRCSGTGRITVARWRKHGLIREKVAVSRRCPVCGGRGRCRPQK